MIIDDRAKKADLKKVLGAKSYSDIWAVADVCLGVLGRQASSAPQLPPRC
jgi:hypothetical protein